MQKHLLEEEHILFQESVRAFMEKEVAPHNERWEKEGKVDRELWLRAGEMGLLCIDFPKEYGGMGIKENILGFN